MVSAASMDFVSADLASMNVGASGAAIDADGVITTADSGPGVDAAPSVPRADRATLPAPTDVFS